MDHNEQITHFAADLDTLVHRYAAEYDLPVVSAVGCLHRKAHELLTTQNAPAPCPSMEITCTVCVQIFTVYKDTVTTFEDCPHCHGTNNILPGMLPKDWDLW